MARIIRLRGVMHETGDSRSTIYSRIAQGLFPKPVHLGPRSRGWTDSEVATINAARIAGKTNDEIRVLVHRLHSARKGRYEHARICYRWLEKVKRTGAGRWIGRCPAHDDRSPSLALRELDDGRVLVHCFAGCSAQEVVTGVGLDLSDLFPSQEIGFDKGSRSADPFLLRTSFGVSDLKLWLL